MFSQNCPDSFSKLKFLQPLSYDLRKESSDFREFIEYQFSACNLATDRFLFNSILKAEDSILPLSVIHSIIHDFGFSFDDLIAILELTLFQDISKLNETHFRLDFRLYRLYHAIAINVNEVLGYHGSRGDPNPWVELKELTLDQHIITTDVDLIAKALASNIPSDVECKVVEGSVLARKAPNMSFYNNELDIVRIEIPQEMKDYTPPKPPVRLFRSGIANAYNPLVFSPKQLLIYRDSNIVSAKQLLDLFPEMKKFIVGHGDYYLTVDNHSSLITSEYLVELHHTTVRVSFANHVLDAKFSIYDSDKYILVWSDEGFSLSCKQPVHSIDVNCIPTSAFLGDRFTVL